MKVCVTVICCLFCFVTSGQEWLEEGLPNNHIGKRTTRELNFYEIQKAYRAYQKESVDDSFLESRKEREKEGDETEGQYGRWEWFTKQRVYPSGRYPELDSYWDDFLRNRNVNAMAAAHFQSAGLPVWHNLISPKLPFGGSATGMGRINCMSFIPGNANAYLVGAATGGIWKTSDDGKSWTCLNTDLLPALSITDIAINPNNVNEIYVVTGDMFAGFPGIGKSLQGQFSAGVLKSTDGGLKWNATGMSFSQNQLMVPQRMLLHPVNDDTLIVASFSGVWRSVNAGKNWTKVKDGIFFSMEMNPKKPDILYLTDANGLWRSDNFGTSWTWKGGGYSKTGSFRISLAISNADTNLVYLWGQGGAFKKYNGTTKTFTTMTSPDALVHPYGLYDRALAVAPWNAGVFFVGGSEAAKSYNGGSNWNLTAQWNNEMASDYIHQDVKRFYFKPGSNYTVFALTDGGIFKTADMGTTWSNISKGIHIGQIYRICNHPMSADTIVVGQQDCASNLFVKSDSSMKQIFGGDGMQSLYDPTNAQNMFVCGAYGNLQKSKDGGKNFSLASPGQCMWLAPYAMNPKNPQTMYIGAKVGVRKSTIGGEFMSWYTVSSAPVLDSIVALAVSGADTNVVYAAKYNKMMRSDDGGVNWVDITSGLPVSNAAIDYIAVSETNRNRVYVCFSGYSATNKIFLTTDGGSNWTNYSGTLSNVPVNCIVHVTGSSNDEVYAGTDFGVYYRNNSISDWIPFNNGLPNVIVNHLQLEYGTMQLRAGTYGRGLWEIDLKTNEFSAETLDSFNSKYISETRQLKHPISVSSLLNGKPVPEMRTAEASSTITLFPNPAKQEVYLSCDFELNACQVKMFSQEGKDVSNSLDISLVSKDACILGIEHFIPGIYLILVMRNNSVIASERLWIQP